MIRESVDKERDVEFTVTILYLSACVGFSSVLDMWSNRASFAFVDK
jgi:hypothetical protein